MHAQSQPAMHRQCLKPRYFYERTGGSRTCRHSHVTLRLGHEALAFSVFDKSGPPNRCDFRCVPVCQASFHAILVFWLSGSAHGSLALPLACSLPLCRPPDNEWLVMCAMEQRLQPRLSLGRIRPQ